MATLDAEEIEGVRELQLWLRGVKVCRVCGVQKFCGEFTGYGLPDCKACEEKAAAVRRQEAREANETAERHARERAQQVADASGICPDCGAGKPGHLPRCRWCQGRWRAGLSVAGQGVA